MADTKYGFVYLWYDIKHHRYYVGCHWGTETDGYVCSSSWMNQARSHRPEDFRRRILTTGIPTKSEMYEEEYRWLSMIKPSEIKPATETPRYYNLKINREKPWHMHESSTKTVGQKISAAKKGKNTGPRDPEVGRRISEAKRASVEAKKAAGIPIYNVSDKVKLANESRRGVTLSEEHKTKTSETLKKYWETHEPRKGHSLSDDHRKKIGAAHKGMKRSNETRENISSALSKEYLIRFTDGSQKVVRGLKKYAEENSIPYITLHKAFKDQTPVRKYSISSINVI